LPEGAAVYGTIAGGKHCGISQLKMETFSRVSRTAEPASDAAAWRRWRMPSSRAALARTHGFIAPGVVGDE